MRPDSSCSSFPGAISHGPLHYLIIPQHHFGTFLTHKSTPTPSTNHGRAQTLQHKSCPTAPHHGPQYKLFTARVRHGKFALRRQQQRPPPAIGLALVWAVTYLARQKVPPEAVEGFKRSADDRDQLVGGVQMSCCHSAVSINPPARR